ncbi:MAG: fibronectin type III domain-containing protein, partial [Anaerolineae bacterium]|nr:fibronectin type III domain-containing protein [Anaerolineae bacterium]
TVANTTRFLSVGVGGTDANASSSHAAIAGNGQIVAFQSDATNLVSDDTNGQTDIFRYELTTSSLALISRTVPDEMLGIANGPPAAGASHDPSISVDGLHIAFVSSAYDADPYNNVYLYVSELNWQIRRLSHAYDGLGSTFNTGDSYAPVISPNGWLVAYASSSSKIVQGDTNNSDDVFVHDAWLSLQNTRLSLSADGQEVSSGGAFNGVMISGDGLRVGFASQGANYLPDDTNGFSDIFMLTTTPRPVAPSHLIASAVSASAVGLTWQDHATDETDYRIERSINGYSWDEIAQLPPNTTSYTDGGLISGYTYQYRVRVFRADDIQFSSPSNTASATVLIMPPSGIVATALSTTEVDVSWVDNSTDETEFRVEYSPDGINWASVSRPVNSTSYKVTGLACSQDYHFRVVTYRSSDNSTAVSVIVTERTLDCLYRIVCAPTAPLALASATSDGFLANADVSTELEISDDGRYVLFQSTASNLVPNDTNNANDIFVYDRQTCAVERVTVDSSGQPLLLDNTNYAIDSARISGDGRYVAFSLVAPVGGNFVWSIMLRDRVNHTTTTIGTGYQLDMSADAHYIAYVAASGWERAIYLYDVVGQTTQHLITGYVNEPELSPNGRYLAWND